MKKYVVYDDDGKCCGFFLPGEERLAKLWVEMNGGHYEEKDD